MYDAIVIGGGPGGYVAAIRGAQLGGKIALVEMDSLGGTCLNRGCIPTKALVHSATVYQTVLNATSAGTRPGDVTLDFDMVMEHKRSVVQKLVGGVEMLLKSNDVDIYKGKASIPGPGKVDVTLENGEIERLDTRNIVIASGSQPARPRIPDQSMALTTSSNEALDLSSPPQSMVVMGGGVLGIEFACIYHAFGTKVTAIKRTPQILPPIEEELGKRMAMILKRQGIDIITGVYTNSIEKDGDGLVLRGDSKKGELELKAERVLMATGRVPFFGDLDLDGLGIDHDWSGIKTDPYLATTVPGIYAIGDVLGRHYLAPVASAEGMVCMDNIFGQTREMDYSVIPNVVFSIPEVASVGLGEKQAREAGHNVAVSKFPYAANGRALAIEEGEGLVKMVADADSGKLLGLHILGAHADELIHEGALALTMGASVADMAHLIHAHPTLSETVMEAAHTLVGGPIHQAPRRRR